MFQRNPSQRADYTAVIEQITNLELQVSSQGLISLPPDLKSASANGQVWVQRIPPSNLLIAFPTWIGKGFNMRGFLYAQLPLSEQEIYSDYYGNNAINIGLTEVVLVKQIDEHWYTVERTLD